MAFDAGMLSFILNDINNKTAGGKVEKIYQPAKDEIVLILRNFGSSERLLINAGSRCPRINITKTKSENPQKAPMLCMLLRKHLQGATFKGAEQLGFERACRLSFDAFDDMGFKCEKHIIVEMMGKYSNIILCDGRDKILTVLRQVDFTQSLRRQLLPGMIYDAPPPQDKLDPLGITRDEFNSRALDCSEERPCEKFIMSNFSGISPLVAREIAFICGGSPSATVRECADTLTEFLMGMLIYQSVFAMKYCPEDFFWYTDEEMQVIRKTMTIMPYKLQNWYSDTIEFYSNAEDNMLYVMSDGNQGTYGAMTSSSYQKIQVVLGEMGEG